MIDSQRYADIKENEHLPSPRGAALRLMELCRQDNVSLTEIVRTLGTDPALAGQVIKMANSPVYARSRPVIALSPEVIASIGILTLRQMVLAFSLISAYRQGECKAFDYATFWSRSTATALAANLLGTLVPAAPHAELFTCGLLSKIGQLTLASVYPDAYSDLLTECHGQSPQALLAQERRAFALDHNQLTAAMLYDWGIPKLFSEAILFHENPSACGYPADSRPYRLVHLFYLAAQLANSCFLDDRMRSTQLPRLFKTAGNIGIEPMQLVRLGDQMLEEWREWSALLHIVSHEVAGFSELGFAAAGSPAMEEAADTGIARGIRLLIADSDAALLLLLNKKLSGLGYTVYTASDGRQAMALFTQHAPHIVITDAVLAEFSGLELCRALRQTPAGRGVYCIVLTAHKEKGHLVAAFQAGADDFLCKPIGAKMLLGRLAAATRIVRLHQTLEEEQQRTIPRHESTTVGAQSPPASLLSGSTGLPNRRYAMARLYEQWNLAERNRAPFCCLRIRIDDFATLAARYGEKPMEDLLRLIARRLQDTARQTDVVCHLEGENFLAVVPNTPLSTALHYAERLSASVRETPFELAGQAVTLTASIGVAVGNPGSEGSDRLLEQAEYALAEAAQGGGGRACATPAKTAASPADDGTPE